MLFQMFLSRHLIVFLAVSCVFGYKRHGRIVGGKKAPLGKFPYAVSIQISGWQTCGGSIISNRWILTSAKCPMPKDVLVGTVNLNKGGVRYPIIKVIHPKGARRQQDLNDIALMKTESEIQFNKHVSPIALGVKKVSGGVEVLFSGWGAMESDIPNAVNLQNKLLYVQSRTITNEKCLEAASKGVGRPIKAEHICTIYTTNSEGMCFGDTGGGLANKDNNKLIGIVSRSFDDGNCGGGMPDVFTRVSSFIHWIKKTMRNDKDDS